MSVTRLPQRFHPSHLIVYGAFVLAWGGLFLARTLKAVAGARRSARFERTTGAVVGGEPARGTRRRRRRIVYEYVVGSTRYRGSRRSYGESSDAAPAAGVNLHAAARDGSTFDVWFDPANPADAVLVRGPAEFPLGRVIEAICAIAAGVTLVAIGVASVVG